MTQKVAVITDSIACLTPELVKEYQMGILPINLYFGDKVYRDGGSSPGVHHLNIDPGKLISFFKKTLSTLRHQRHHLWSA